MILFGAFLIPIVAPYYFRKGKIGIFHYILFISILIFSTSLLMIRNYLVCGSYAFISEGATTSSLQFLTMTNPIPPSVDLSMTKARPFYATMHFNGILSDYSEYMIQKPAIFFGHYFKKILFCLGFLQYFEPAYRWRPHWILMWIGYFAYLFIHWKRRAGFEMWEIALNIYILSYYCLLVIAAMIGNYGFRYLIPAVPFLLPLSFKALDQMMPLPRRPHS